MPSVRSHSARSRQNHCPCPRSYRAAAGLTALQIAHAPAAATGPCGGCGRSSSGTIVGSKARSWRREHASVSRHRQAPPYGSKSCERRGAGGAVATALHGLRGWRSPQQAAGRDRGRTRRPSPRSPARPGPRPARSCPRRWRLPRSAQSRRRRGLAGARIRCPPYASPPVQGANARAFDFAPAYAGTALIAVKLGLHAGRMPANGEAGRRHKRRGIPPGVPGVCMSAVVRPRA